MKRIIFLLVIIASMATAASANGAEAPAPQYDTTFQDGQRVEAYYFNSRNNQIETITIKVKGRRIIEYWANNVWQACSIKAVKNSKGETRILETDNPENIAKFNEWVKLSRKFEWRAEINGLQIYFDIATNSYH